MTKLLDDYLEERKRHCGDAWPESVFYQLLTMMKQVYPTIQECALRDELNLYVLRNFIRGVVAPKSTVTPIDVNSKYVVHINEELSTEERARIRKEVTDWLKSDVPIYVLLGNDVWIEKVESK